MQSGCAVVEKDASLHMQRRRGLRAARTSIGLSLALALITAALSMAQTTRQFSTYQGKPVHQQQENTSSRLGDLNDGFPAGKEKQLRALNALRQKAMVSDTAKLLKLATELNAEASAGNSDSLTPSELRKLAAIEKLARSVKQKMSLALGGGIDYRDPFISANP